MEFLLRQCLRLGYNIPAPLSPLLAGRAPSVLLYHGVPRGSPAQGTYRFDGEAFEQQLLRMQRHFEFIHPRDLFLPRSLWRRKAVLLTFDDGFQNNATVAAPILIEHRIPALFFVCNRDIAGGVLWFSYLHALEHCFAGDSLSFRGRRYDMRPRERAASVAALRACLLGLRPHPAAMYAAIAEELPPVGSFVAEADFSDWYALMSEEQIARLDANPLFAVECHTVDHPMLTWCEPAEAARQIADNKSFLERVCNRRATSISYPSGDYDAAVVELCKEMGLATGYAVVPRLNQCDQFEIPRSGVYRPWPEIAAFKAMWSRRRTRCG